jgi:hypothetical protein
MSIYDVSPYLLLPIRTLADVQKARAFYDDLHRKREPFRAPRWRVKVRYAANDSSWTGPPEDFVTARQRAAIERRRHGLSRLRRWARVARRAARRQLGLPRTPHDRGDRRGGGAMKIDWTDEMIAALRQLREDRRSLLDCADRIGVAYNTARRKARELGLNARPRRHHDRIAALRGLPPSEIARRLGIGRTTVWRHRAIAD